MGKESKKDEKEIKEGEACEKNAPETELSREDELLLEIEKLKQQIKDCEDKHLRMAAEYDNFRRRSREEKDATYENALSDTVAELLPIIDNLERAANFEDGEKVKEGLAMTLKSVSAVFSALGIEAVGKVGERFDPNLHNAVMHIDDDSFGEGEIVEVFERGYKKNKKVIRFAMVKTAN